LSNSTSTLVLTRSDVAALLPYDACIDAVEAAFRAHAAGRANTPGVLGAHVTHGGFHVKTAGLIAPPLMAASRVVVDVLDQCAAFGDLHHAIAAGAMQRGDVHADLAGIVSGAVAGRCAADEVFVFDSTGTALQDVAAAALVYESALQAGTGIYVTLGS
jgi:ornithine cyclodeaminase/alanine dehydrogenase-like protein (mu-crystallin family)